MEGTRDDCRGLFAPYWLSESSMSRFSSFDSIRHASGQSRPTGLMSAPDGPDGVGGLLTTYITESSSVFTRHSFSWNRRPYRFWPLIANPRSVLLGAAAQLGIFTTFIGALLLRFSASEAASIGIIGGADGPTAIFLTSRLAPHLLGPVAVAAYSYMALVPVIQPPIMRLLTTPEERATVMEQLRPVSRTEKIVFPIVVAVLGILLVPQAAALLGCLMLGNLIRESGVADRLLKTAQNELINIVTILLGVSVGATATAERFLNAQAIGVFVLGIAAFSLGTAGGVLLGKAMYRISGGKINPLIGAAGVSAVPMAARVVQKVGQKEPFKLLAHARQARMAGVIGSAIAAGVLLSIYG